MNTTKIPNLEHKTHSNPFLVDNILGFRCIICIEKKLILVNNKEVFNFYLVIEADVKMIILNLDKNKANVTDENPAKVLKNT